MNYIPGILGGILVTAYVYADISAFLIKIFVPYRIYWEL